MKLILLDRDGVINVSPGKSYVMCPEEFILYKGAGEAIALLNKALIKVAIVTNQSIVGQGGLHINDLHRIHDHLDHLLKPFGAWIDKIFFCPDPPHAPTHRRKPNPGMLEEALMFFKADPASTPLIGDSLTDLIAAQKAGCPRHLVLTGHGSAVLSQGIPSELLPVMIHDNLLAAVSSLLKN